MALNVFTNVSSLNAQRNLNNSQAALSKSLQRLSSGLRINSAADDAAGMAISNGLTSQSRGFNQAIRNAGDGLSLFGTAEGSIEQQTNILQRMRELAVQSASDSNSSLNRTDLDSEASQLKSEFERIARTTQFNGLNLLDGTFQSKDLQVGAYATANDRISVSFASTRAADVGNGYSIVGTTVTANALAGGDLNVVSGGVSYAVAATVTDGVSTVGGTYSALAKANAINAVSSSSNVTADASTTATATATQTAGALIANDMKINGVDVGAVAVAGAADNALVSAINSKYSSTGVTAALDNTNQIVLTAADGRNIDLAMTANGTAVAHFATATNRGTVTLRSVNSFSISGANETYIGGTDNQAATQAANENVNAISLTSKTNARLAVTIVDVALSQLNSRRATIGALTNRLNTTISNLTTAAQNADAANSRIADADFASETAIMSKNQILQQAGIAILSQANQNPQQALSLLR